MALPLIFMLAPVVFAIILGGIFNIEYQGNPPLLFGSISPAWPIGFGIYPIEAWYWIKKAFGAKEVRWLNWRYWIGEHPYDVQLKVKNWNFVGTAEEKVALKPGEKEPRKMVGVTSQTTGFIETTKHPKAGNLIYEFWFDSKKFPLAILRLTEVPEKMLNFTGNFGLVQNGGLLFPIKNITSVSFVRTDFTKTDEIPFVPVGVITDCSQRAIEVRDGLTETLPEGIAAAALTRDNFHASQFRREAIDERKLRELIEKQERDMDKEVDRRVGEVLKRKQKGEAGLTPSKTSKIVNDYGGIIIVVVIIVGAVLAWRFA